MDATVFIDKANKAMEQGASYEVAGGGFVNELAQAAAAGDARVIYEGSRA